MWSASIIILPAMLTWFVSAASSGAALLAMERPSSAIRSQGDESMAVRAFLENARKLDGDGAGEASSSIDPAAVWGTERLQNALDEPEKERGRFAVLLGRLEQVTPGEASTAGTSECFIRVPGFGPVLVLASSDDLQSCAISDQVRVEGWFHRIEEAFARDGRQRRYPVFVGRVRVRAEAGLGENLPLVPLVVGVSCLMLGGLWLILRRRLGHPLRTSILRIGASSSDFRAPLDRPDTDLPSDPARALDELARRGDD